MADSGLALEPHLAAELRAVNDRLREIEAQEARPTLPSGVFVSYSHRDAAFVKRLVGQFQTDRIDCWLDEKDLLVGQVIDRTISSAIQHHSLFLVVLSSASIQSRWVQRELDEAAHEETEGRKLLLPLIAEGLSLDQVPPRLRRFKCADFNSGFDEGYEPLKRSILRHLDPGAPG